MSQRVEEIVRKLTAMDDILFYKLAENKDFCEELLQVILQNNKLRLLEHTPQYALKNIRGRSVILDLKCVDEIGKIINVEVQKRDYDDHQKRVRYNMANMDTEESEKGISFEELSDIYVIYISEFDVFGKGKTIYHVNRVLAETQDVVENGTHEIYVNTKIDDGTEIAEYMKLLSSNMVEAEGKFQRSRQIIRGIKVGKEDMPMCNLVEEYAKEYADEQKIELMVEGYIEGQNTLSFILRKLDLTEEQFMEYVQKYKDKSGK